MRTLRTILAVVISITWVMSACNQSVKRVKILPYSSLHNDNSKVWLLEKQVMNGEDITPEKREERIVMTLYKDRTFMVHLISQFAYYSENNGEFELEDGGEKITFIWGGEEQVTYNIIDLSDDVLEYETPSSISPKQYLKFIPINKPKPTDQPSTSVPSEVKIKGVN